MDLEESELYEKACVAAVMARTAIELAMDEGKQPGKLEGRQEGKAEMLLRQLQRRFGRVPAWVQTKVLSASAHELDAWSERIFDTDPPSSCSSSWIPDPFPTPALLNSPPAGSGPPTGNGH